VTMKGIFLILFAIFLYTNAQNGTINAGATVTPNAGNFIISWNTCNNNGVAVIYITLASPYQGWIGLQPKIPGGPIAGNVGHVNTDIIWAWIDNAGYVYVYDMYSANLYTPMSNGANCTVYGSCSDIDTAFGGTNDVTCVAGKRDVNGVTITFKRNFFATDKYDISFNGNQTIWALGKDSIPNSYHDLSNQAFMHCKDCLKPIYNATCGLAILNGLRASCGYNTTSIGYVARNANMPIQWWNGTDPNTLPNCAADPVTFPTTTCLAAPPMSTSFPASVPPTRAESSHLTIAVFLLVAIVALLM